MKILAAATAALVLAQPSLAASSSLAPSSQWIVQSSDETCRVVRQFGSKADPVTLSFEQIAPRSPLSMMAVGGPLRVPSLRTRSPVTADFSGIPLAHFVADVSAKTADGHDLLIWRSITFRPNGRQSGVAQGRRGRGGGSGFIPLDTQQKWRTEAYGREREVQALTVNMGRGGDSVELQTGPVSGAMGSLRSCMDRQLRSWGLDPATERKVVSAPVAQTRPDSWLEFSGATKLSLKRDELAPVTVRLLVDARGEVTNCKASAPRDGAAYEAALCEHITRSAAILPAKTDSGEAVPSYLVATLRRSSGL